MNKDEQQEAGMAIVRTGWFYHAQKAKLWKNRHKGTWTNMSDAEILRKLYAELDELQDALDEHGDVVEECLDAANYLLMLADNWRQQAQEGGR